MKTNSTNKVTLIHRSGKVSVYSLSETETMALENAFTNAKKRSPKDIQPELYVFSSIYTSKTSGAKKVYEEKTLVDLSSIDSISINHIIK